ncbi:hypothetical protein CBR_g931 [Chara braunii]|uniref:Uncharacterized protein n=1 Tax=Chara braunii TaxID=69332 RepID=A0A388KCS5_CHABU|nr:hypothetical protein CBR_g931 [Chara braunii]|eukprot:GBG67807.1 hypothetical protein CBR_g931 [Chara braunii]
MLANRNQPKYRTLKVEGPPRAEFSKAAPVWRGGVKLNRLGWIKDLIQFSETNPIFVADRRFSEFFHTPDGLWHHTVFPSVQPRRREDVLMLEKSLAAIIRHIVDARFPVDLSWLRKMDAMPNAVAAKGHLGKGGSGEKVAAGVHELELPTENIGSEEVERMSKGRPLGDKGRNQAVEDCQGNDAAGENACGAQKGGGMQIIHEEVAGQDILRKSSDSHLEQIETAWKSTAHALAAIIAYQAAFFEILRQVEFACKERAHLLGAVWEHHFLLLELLYQIQNQEDVQRVERDMEKQKKIMEEEKRVLERDLLELKDMQLSLQADLASECLKSDYERKSLALKFVREEKKVEKEKACNKKMQFEVEAAMHKRRLD